MKVFTAAKNNTDGEVSTVTTNNFDEENTPAEGNKILISTLFNLIQGISIIHHDNK